MKHFLISLFISLFALSAWAAETVNINQASAEEIAEALTGVGVVKAEEIVRYREANGAFQHADELVNVKGMGLATVDKNRDRIIVDGASVQSQE
jgi:competence protein ComEA